MKDREKCVICKKEFDVEDLYHCEALEEVFCKDCVKEMKKKIIDKAIEELQKAKEKLDEDWYLDEDILYENLMSNIYDLH